MALRNEAEAHRKAWDTRGRAVPGSGSGATQVRGDFAVERDSRPRQFDPEPSEQDVLRHTKEHFGKEMSREDLADIAGAPPGSTMKIGLGARSGWIGVRADFPDGAGYCERTLKPGGTIQNDSMHIERTGHGLGLSVFEREVDSAIKHGFQRIEVEAVGANSPHTTLNGYYTWARMGFESDGKVWGPDGSMKMTSLMMRPGGAKWWKENGRSFAGHFDLSPTSASMLVFRQYRELKRRANQAKRGAAWATQ